MFSFKTIEIKTLKFFLNTRVMYKTNFISFRIVEPYKTNVKAIWNIYLFFFRVLFPRKMEIFWWKNERINRTRFNLATSKAFHAEKCM